jgi:hypothetical protein
MHVPKSPTYARRTYPYRLRVLDYSSVRMNSITVTDGAEFEVTVMTVTDSESPNNCILRFKCDVYSYDYSIHYS